MTRTLIHLVRHAEVENPNNTWYGRLDGFVLSERGLRQAAALADYFTGRDVAGVYCSPLTRAVQTATAIAEAHGGLEVATDPDLIESLTYLEGQPADQRVFLKLRNLRYFVNPFRPSWGESYRGIAERMSRAIARMRAEHPGREVVAVSHMTPIVVARLATEASRRPAWMSGIPCHRASITTLAFEDGRYAATEYEPVGSRVS